LLQLLQLLLEIGVLLSRGMSSTEQDSARDPRPSPPPETSHHANYLLSPSCAMCGADGLLFEAHPIWRGPYNVKQTRPLSYKLRAVGN
jgi:hypothetical protein